MTDSPAPPPGTDRLEHFAANVAHDFNNLLTGMLGNLELMQMRAKRTGVTSFDTYLEGARNAGNRAAIFAQRLLAFSGRATQAPALLALDNLIPNITAPLRAERPALATDLGAGNAQILCDPALAELALQELLRNALDATPATGAITLTTRVTDHTLTLTIHNTGPGMTPEILARATEPFFTTRPNGAGKGLGLAIAERFARQANGTLHLASPPAQGTTATLRLPVTREQGVQ